MSNATESSAKIIFNESLRSLMAHSVRGIVNHFRRQQIDLDVQVKPGRDGVIELHAPNKGATCVLMTSYSERKRPTERDRLNATIYIHEDANKHLARVCIAHEIYHLMLELDHFIKSGRKAWPKIPLDPGIEDTCNHFAWELCRLHDVFNKNEDERKKHIFFPENTFVQPFKMSDSKEWSMKWPNGFALDHTNPFWK